MATMMLLVGEGEQVQAGQLIAEMGSTSTDSVKLHFEIRRNGVPVDPEGLFVTAPLNFSAPDP